MHVLVCLKIHALCIFVQLKEVKQISQRKSRVWFMAHLGLVILAWTGPFIFDWYLMIAGYSVVLLQFVVFRRCLINARHNLNEEVDDHTFYAELLESIGIYLPRKPLKKFVRNWLYILLGGFAFCLQYFGGYVPPLHWSWQ